MDCKNFKELLDSYLSEELTVESNHSILRHAEHCQGCRIEMASRRNLRVVLKRACSRESMSDEACERLRAMLRSEATDDYQQRQDRGSDSWKKTITGLFNVRWMLPVAAAAVLLLTAGIGLWINLRNGVVEQVAVLKPVLFDEALGDHNNCATKFLTGSGPTAMPESAAQYDAAYAGLDRVASVGAEGLNLRSAHVCRFKQRRFAHLVYTKDSQLISLLVTERDRRALGTEQVPIDDGVRAGLQHARRDKIALGAYQTRKHVVIVVSDYPEQLGKELAEKLATPVADHLRRVEGQVAYEQDGNELSVLYVRN